MQPAYEAETCSEDFAGTLSGMHTALNSRLQRHEELIAERFERLEVLVRRLGEPNRQLGPPSGQQHEAQRNEAPPNNEFVVQTKLFGGGEAGQMPAELSANPGSQKVVQKAVSKAISKELQPYEDFQASLTYLRSMRSKGMKRFPPLNPHYRISRWIHDWKFSVLVSICICANSVTIGMQTNYAAGEAFAAKLGRPSRALSVTVPDWVNTSFVVFFAVELLLRFFVERSQFLLGTYWRWNVFDFSLVCASIVEVIADTRNLSFCRALRLLRTVHVLQVIRVFKVFDTLRFMVYSILNSMLSVVWIIVLLLLLLYVYGIYALSIAHGALDDMTAEEARESAAVGALDELFGTLSVSIFSLFAAVTGGRDWVDIMKPLAEIHWIHGVVFILFIIFIVLGVMNIVTGIFVDKATELTKVDKEMEVMKQLDEMDTFVKEVKSFFEEVDVDSDGTVTWEEFQSKLRLKEVRAYFSTLGLDARDVKRVFTMLDRRGEGTVNIKDFVEGCIRIRGQAQSLDICVLMQDTHRLNYMLEVFMQYTEDKLGVLYSMLNQPSASTRPVVGISERLGSLMEERRSANQSLDCARSSVFTNWSQH